MKTGEGSYLDVNLLETGCGYLLFYLERYWTRGHLPPKSGTEHESLCPYNVFPTADRPVLLAIANNNSWTRFCSVVDRPGLMDDPRLATNTERAANRDYTNETVRSILVTKPRAAWIEPLQRAGVSIAPVNTMAELLDEPQVKARGIIMDYEHPDIGAAHCVAHPVTFDGDERKVDRAPPRHGEHSVELMRELGYSDKEIEELRRERVLAQFEPK
jgi:crotonobetainyl-CoA:carnitine CoA-transferase CaiB-like acyl-CoA transferase